MHLQEAYFKGMSVTDTKCHLHSFKGRNSRKLTLGGKSHGFFIFSLDSCLINIITVLQASRYSICVLMHIKSLPNWLVLDKSEVFTTCKQKLLHLFNCRQNCFTSHSKQDKLKLTFESRCSG